MDGSQQYKLHCCLTSFQSGANQFCSTLSSVLGDPYQFVKELAKASEVVDESSGISTHRGKRASGMCICFMLLCMVM